MNRNLTYIWVTLTLTGFVLTDFLTNFIILSLVWLLILYIGIKYTFKFGDKLNYKLCLYWGITLSLGTLLSATQYFFLLKDQYFLPIEHISTIWMALLGFNFVISSIISRIFYFGPLGVLMIVSAILLEPIKFSFPGTTYGLLINIVLVGYIALTYITPYNNFNLGKRYAEANGELEENLHQIHKFKCSNCGFVYESFKRIDHCPRCMAGADLLFDVD